MKRTVTFISLILLCWAYPLYALDVVYQYDTLNRLKLVNYGNGQHVITYDYDAAGNILSKAVAVSPELPPILTITSPLDGAVVFSNTITLQGTASDAGQGDNGIASVAVYGDPAAGGSATGAEPANWSISLPLKPGSNTFPVVATDASPYAITQTKNITVVYLPQIIDSDSDGLPNVWELANSLNPNVNNASFDTDLDGFTDAEEYAAGTDPQLDSSKPEGVNDIHYVLFRDHFDDNLYDDRWFLGAVDPGVFHGLFEFDGLLYGFLLQPATACSGLLLESFATINAANAVLHAQLSLQGEGVTSLGLMQDQDLTNSIDIRFDYQNSPYLSLHSWDDGIETIVPAGQPVNIAGLPLDLRLTKLGADYTLIVNGLIHATVTNNGLGDNNLRPYISLDSCPADLNVLDSSFDLIEILLDRDADGLADLHEDKNINGLVDTGESDPLVPDADNDTVLDGLDNCLFTFNGLQRDTDTDGIGNSCDPDFNNNCIVDGGDFTFLKSRIFTLDPDADLNGNGIVDGADFSQLKNSIFKIPGPSGYGSCGQ